MRDSSVPRDSIVAYPARPGTGNKGSRIGPLEIEDDSDEFADELAAEVLRSSPFFTQPTQIVNRTTQPTQIVNRTTQPTQIINRTTQPTQIINRTTQPTQIISRTTQPTQILNRTSLPLRGSSPPGPSSPTSPIEVPASSPFQTLSSSSRASHARPMSSIASPSNARPLAKEPRRIGNLMAPAGTSFRPPVAPRANSNSQIKQKHLSISDDDLSKDYIRDGSSSSDEDTPMRGNIRPSSFVRKEPVRSSDLRLEASKRQDQEDKLGFLTQVLQSKLPDFSFEECKEAMKSHDLSIDEATRFLLKKSASSRGQKPVEKNNAFSRLMSTYQHSAGNKNSDSRSGSKSGLPSLSVSPSPSPSPSHNKFDAADKAPPRRRLVQGRRNNNRDASPPSSSPPPVFSVSSSPTTAASSPNNRQAAGITQKTDGGSQQSNNSVTLLSVTAKDVRPRRRLIRGRRNRSSPPAQIIELSDSDPSASGSARKRKAEDAPIDLTDDIDELAMPDNIDLDSEDEEVLSDTSVRAGAAEQSHVLKYLNNCTTDELARMIGLPTADAQLMLDARPFRTLGAVERVSRMDKAKSKKKAKKVEIGSQVVEKLSTWFEAFTAASTVIQECDRRGVKIQSTMSKWNFDKNGKKKDGAGLVTLPISKKPSDMDGSLELKSYQLFGLNWMNLLHDLKYSAILADDMGLGKTCQVVSFISHIVSTYDEQSSKRAHWPNLIVVPPGLYDNWMAEFAKFAPQLVIFGYVGSNRRDFDPEEAQDCHVVLTTYSQLERSKEDVQWLQELDPYTSIFDEGHRLKNPNTKIYKQLMRVPSEWRLVMSGTPVQNNLKELLALLHFVEPGLFQGDFEKLSTIFEAKVPNKEVHNFAALAKERVANARTVVSPFILQRRKADVLELPSKTERKIIVEMSDEQKEIYGELRADLISDAKTPKKTKVKNNPWMNLRKASIHHQLFRRHFTDEKVAKMVDILWKSCSETELNIQSKEDKHKQLLLDNYLTYSDFQLHLECKGFPRYISKFDIPHLSWENSPKVQKLLELVRGYQKNGDKVLVFSRFDMVIDILRETFHHADIEYCEITGSVGVADRFPEVERFNEDPNIPVFLLTTGAGGVGLNLTSANKIILFDQSDNPQDDEQASNRAHRIGQKRDVEIIRIITKDTVEQLIYNSCVKKLMLARCVEGEYPIDDESEIDIEAECRKLMLLEDEKGGKAEEMAVDTEVPLLT